MTETVQRQDVTFKISRSRPGNAAPPRFDTFVVPCDARTTVLVALQTIRRTLDPTLMVRHSCHHASCGTCGVRINGQEQLACLALAQQPGGRTITVEPLANLPLVGDLVVDSGPLMARLAEVDVPTLRTSEAIAGSTPPDGDDSATSTRFESCLECGICVSSCPITAMDPDYLGPAALAAAWRIVQEPRGRDARQILAWAAGENGCWRCHIGYECTHRCPSAVDPGGAIMGLRRQAVWQRSHIQQSPPTRTSAVQPGHGRRLPGIASWIDLRGRGVGSWAFALNRLTGLGLLFYLYLHLGVLTLLLGGEAGWNALIALARSPALLGLDLVLLAGVVYHALNGVRVALVGLGVASNWQRTLWFGVLGLTSGLVAISGWLLLTR